jgi:hypothetical protein
VKNNNFVIILKIFGVFMSESSSGGESPNYNTRYSSGFKSSESVVSNNSESPINNKNPNKNNSEPFNLKEIKQFLKSSEQYIKNHLVGEKESIINNTVLAFRDLVLINEDIICRFPNNSTLLKIAEDNSDVEYVHKIISAMHEKIASDKKANSKIKYW